MTMYTNVQKSKSEWTKNDKFMVFLGGATLSYFIAHDLFMWIHREFFAIACYAKDYI
ncbi:hypothetical protein KXJ72_17590 (plasmid) [Comamonas aquatica]|nr:hypothetical protein KXJ72_17590 [Comamonas aquatica]